jgi:hypothetical protein
MGAPIRSAEEITQIINRGQHAIASLGLEIVQDAKRGADNNDPDWRWKQMRLILLRSFYQNILTVDGTINNFYAASLNEKAENNILTGILKLSGIYSGPAIPKLTGDNLPMYFFPSSSGVSTGGNSGGAATPGGITFEALDVDAPGEVVDRIEANGSNYAFYIVNVYGNGAGEGSKGAVLLVTWRGASSPVVTEYGGADVGGTTTGVTFSAALVSGYIELTANVPTDNWTIRGTRISFQNISFQNPLGPMPAGGTTGQYLRKSSNLDYATEWSTLLWQYITDVTASLAEINRVTGVTSPIQTQLAARLLLAGGTMSGAIAMGNNKVTGLAAGTANGDALRYEQLKISGSESILFTTVQLGFWNMVSTSSIFIAHGLDYTKIISCHIKILVDVGIGGYDLTSAGTSGYDSSNIIAARDSGGLFDSTSFNDPAINRGEALIFYRP